MDSSFLVDYLRGEDYTLHILESDFIDDPAIPAIALYEVYAGAARSDARDSTIEVVADAVNWATILPFDDAAAREAARIRSDLLDAGDMISIPDILIAATAVSRDLHFYTADTDFQKIPRFQPMMIDRSDFD